MFSRVYWAKFRPEEGEEVIRVARESIPVFNRLPGFERVTYLYDQASGLGFAFSVWASSEDAQASGERVANVVEQFGRYAVEEPEGASPAFGVDTSFPVFEVIAEG